MKKLRLIILTILLTVFISADSTFARQKQGVAEPTGLALEIIFFSVSNSHALHEERVVR